MLWFRGRLWMTTDSLPGCMIRAREGISLPRGFNLPCFLRPGVTGWGKKGRRPRSEVFLSFSFVFPRHFIMDMWWWPPPPRELHRRIFTMSCRVVRRGLMVTSRDRGWPPSVLRVGGWSFMVGLNTVSGEKNGVHLDRDYMLDGMTFSAVGAHAVMDLRVIAGQTSINIPCMLRGHATNYCVWTEHSILHWEK